MELLCGIIGLHYQLIWQIKWLPTEKEYSIAIPYLGTTDKVAFFSKGKILTDGKHLYGVKLLWRRCPPWRVSAPTFPTNKDFLLNSAKNYNKIQRQGPIILFRKNFVQTNLKQTHSFFLLCHSWNARWTFVQCIRAVAYSSTTF